MENLTIYSDLHWFNNLTNEEKLNEIKNESVSFGEIMKEKIDTLCNNLKYQDGSRFSYISDRLENFIDELNSFEILGK